MKTIGNEDVVLGFVAYKIFTKFRFEQKLNRQYLVNIKSIIDIFAEIEYIESKFYILELEDALYELKANGNITDYQIFKEINFFSFY